MRLNFRDRVGLICKKLIFKFFIKSVDKIKIWMYYIYMINVSNYYKRIGGA